VTTGVCGCGFHWDVAAAGVIGQLRSFPAAYRACIDGLGTGGRLEGLRRRPAPGVWSILEYTAHTVDAVEWYDRRIRLVLSVDRPSLTGFDWDAACEDRRYVDQDPESVVVRLDVVTGGLADMLGGLGPRSWEAVGIGSDGGDRRVIDLARRACHEERHHLHDIRRIAALPGAVPGGDRGRQP